jgi:hypothetical protein
MYYAPSESNRNKDRQIEFSIIFTSDAVVILNHTGSSNKMMYRKEFSCTYIKSYRTIEERNPSR